MNPMTMPPHRLGRLAAVLAVFLLLAGCSGDDGDKGPVLATIDDYQVLLPDFEQQLAAELEYNREVKLTRRVKERFLDEMIRKELLIQEATRLGLDRQEAFVRSIERYWESMLIRNLLEIKGREIESRILVSDEEIEARYDRMQQQDGPLPPLDTFRDQVHDLVREEKKSQMLDRWIGQLREKADVSIDRALLHAH